LQELLNIIHLRKMPKVKYGTEEYRNAYNKRSLANYDFNSKTYNLARPLPDIVAEQMGGRWSYIQQCLR
jgi:hypothetical protein